MNLSMFIPMAMAPETTRLVVYAFLGLLGLGLLSVVAVFAYSIWKQRKYNRTALPDLGLGPVKHEEEDDDSPSSAFALDLVNDDPISKNAFATKIDDEFAFDSLRPPLATAPEPETALPDLGFSQPAPPRGPKPVITVENYDEDADELPPFQVNSEYLTPELIEASRPRAARDLDDDEDLDFTPVIQREDSTSQSQGFRKLRLPVDKIENEVESSEETKQEPYPYAGKRRAQN